MGCGGSQAGVSGTNMSSSAAAGVRRPLQRCTNEACMQTARVQGADLAGRVLHCCAHGLALDPPWRPGTQLSDAMK